MFVYQQQKINQTRTTGSAELRSPTDWPFYPDRELKQFVQMIDTTDLKHSPHLQAVIPLCEQNQ